jgi:hypothetical protein
LNDLSIDAQTTFMKRYTFYFLVALFTFGIGSYFALKSFWSSNSHTSVSPQFLNNFSSKTAFKSTFPKPFDPSQKLEEKLTKPFCNDKNILPIWKVLLKDKHFQEQSPFSLEGKLGCEDLLEIKRVDLNNDGNKEIPVRGKNGNLCSAVGNCQFWIYEKKAGKYKKLLHETDYIDVSKLGEQILKKRTRGYYDILLKWHIGAPDTGYQFYKFDGKKYRLTRDLVNAYSVDCGGKTTWEMISATRFWNRNR